MGAAGAAAAMPGLSVATARDECSAVGADFETLVVPLNGRWFFKLDRTAGARSYEEVETAQRPGESGRIAVPHTWQIQTETANYMGVVWYKTEFDAPAGWLDKTVRVEFQAVTHSAKVWLNDTLVGEHPRKGYTAFTFDITKALRFGAVNTLVVRVDNSLNPTMLPRGKSFDWTVDGGIIRPVSLLVTLPTYIERIEIDAVPDLTSIKPKERDEGAETRISLRAAVRNNSGQAKQVRVSYRILESNSQCSGAVETSTNTAPLAPHATATLTPPGTTQRMSLWHFDQPKLYWAVVTLESDGRAVHCYRESFGVRKFEAEGGAFYLNGERVRLMGVERMAGSNPDFGMAEPSSWIEHDHNDLKELNCVFTRVHWQQDRRVLDYCDRHGILIQEEVPAWGPDTFKGMHDEPSPEIMQNGLEQLREMIERDRNHPSIIAWGLCNEVDGKNPPAQKFIRRMAEEARKLDPTRPLTYASHSLYENPERDVAGELDFISWNEYYGSWHEGDPDSVRKTLEAIHRAFPSKPIVISEYGYCECTPDRLGGDTRRIEILREHTNVFREYEYVAGAIFFDYNDYRTHVGDKGLEALKQRVHGVVDLYGERKPSFQALRNEGSPFSELKLTINGRWITASILTRVDLPAYTVEGYTLRAIVYGFGDLPMEQYSVLLPKMAPGEGVIQEVPFEEKAPQRIRVDVLRPTGFSAATAWWKP
jgi:beta-galactosidase